MPRAVVVITTPSGAAIRDVLSILKRHFPALPVVVYPVPVQGAGAATEAAHRVLCLLAVLLVIYFVAVRARRVEGHG